MSSNAFDFNDASPQGSGDLIPADTVLPVELTVRQGGYGEDGTLTEYKSGAVGLSTELTVIAGLHERRKIWRHLILSGPTDGHKKAGDISRQVIRAMLESARGVKPTDDGDQAQAARRIASFAELHGLRFVILSGIEKGTGGYDDRENVKKVITPDHEAWVNLATAPNMPAKAAPLTSPGGASAPASGAGSAPAWAQ